MKALEILQELQASRTEFSRILKDPTIKIGFECEMFVEVDGITPRGGSPVDPDQLDWDSLRSYLDMSSRDQEDLDNELDEFHSLKIQQAWDKEKADFTRKWCKVNGYSSDDEDEMEDIIAERMDDAFESWMGENADDIRADNDWDEFISAEYGTNTRLIRTHGLQAEYGMDENGSIFTEESADIDVSEHYEEISERIADAIDVTFGTDEMDEWQITKDGSLPDDWDESYAPCEIISGVYQIGEGLGKLTSLFDWMKTNAQTNHMTGLHINLSLEGYDASDYDFLKMAVLFDESFAANIFSRLGNTYAKQMRNRILGVLNKDFKVSAEDKLDPREVIVGNSLPAILDALRKIGDRISIEFGKYSSIKNRGNGVFEFRGMGGKGYHTKGDDIRKQVVHMANILVAGADDRAHVKEYLTKVVQMIGTGKFHSSVMGSGQIKDDKLPRHLKGLADLLNGRPLLADAAEQRPTAFLRALGIAMFQKKINLSKAQSAYLRQYVTQNSINAETFRAEIRRDDAYNQIARIMNWPLALPIDDIRQQTLGFAHPGTASWAPQPVVDPADLPLDQRLSQTSNTRIRDAELDYSEWRTERDQRGRAD